MYFQVKEELQVSEEVNGHSGSAGGEGMKDPLTNLGNVVSNLYKFTKEHK